MDQQKIRDILLEYQYKRDRNQDLRDQREEEIFSKFPDIKSVVKEINKNGLRMTKAAIRHASEKELEELEFNQDFLINRKNDLFKRYNIPKDYLEIKYDCKECKDTGFLESGRKCKCLQQRMLREIYLMSNLENILKKDNFDNFRLDIFSDEKIEEFDNSPRENMKDLFNIANRFVVNFDKKTGTKADNLLFMGTAGVGKTFMCSCIAKEIIDKGNTVIYQTAFNLMDVLERHKFKTESYSLMDEENYSNLFEADLLIIDDLGTELTNSFTISELFNIINSRIISGKKMIISTNLNVSELRDTYSDRIVSRIIGNFEVDLFFGKDLRFKK